MPNTRADYAVLPLPLTSVERQELSDHEATIARGLKTFYDVAAAFVHIKQRKLYRADYRTFEEYCQKKWDIDRSYADRMIEAAEVRQNLVPIGTVLPEKESHARALVGLTAEQQRQVWPKVVETAPNGKITAQYIKDVRQQEIPMPAPKQEPVAAPVHQVNVFVPPDAAPVKNCKICQYHKNRNSSKEGVYIPGGTGKCTRPGGHCNPDIVAGYLKDYGRCAKCGKQLTGPGTFWYDNHHQEQAICDACVGLERQRAAQEIMDERDAEREPEAVIKDELELEPAETTGGIYGTCHFCGSVFTEDNLYSATAQNGYLLSHICRSCASKALHELLDPSDPDVLAEASLHEAHLHCTDRDKIMQAGLRLFRAIDEEFKPGQRVRELKEYTPTGAKDGNPLMGSWKRIETFPTTAALKRRIAELEHDKTCIFENRL